MKNIPTFDDIKHFSKLVESNDYFQQYTNEQISEYKEANFLSLKYSPTLPEFKLIEAMHIDYQLAIGQKYSNIYWPKNTGIFLDVFDYLTTNNYLVGKNNLYYLPHKIKINSKHFLIHEVNAYTMKYFLKLNYQENLNFKEIDAKKMRSAYTYLFDDPDTKFYLAYLNKKPVGSMILTTSPDFLEIKELLTNQADRKKGIATSLIHFAGKKAMAYKQTLIVLADSEDSPRFMYEKLGFILAETQINIRKALF